MDDGFDESICALMVLASEDVRVEEALDLRETRGLSGMGDGVERFCLCRTRRWRGEPLLVVLVSSLLRCMGRKGG